MKIHKLDILIAVYVFGIMVAELMGAKTFPVATIGSFTLNASVAIFVVPLLFTLTDVIAEVKGRARARSVALSGLITIFLVLGFTLLAVHLPASERFAPRDEAYSAVFSASARIAFASIVAFAVAQLLDVAIFSKLREKMRGRALWLRNNASNAASQLVDATVFIVIAFYAFGSSFDDNMSFLLSLIIPYWILRCIFSALGTPLAYAGVRWLRGRGTLATQPTAVKEVA